MQGYSEAPDGSETESGEDDGDGDVGLTANNNAASIQQEQVLCDGFDSVILTYRPSIERSRRLLPLLRRRRTSRIGGALCILPIIRYLFYNLHAYPGQTRRTRPRIGKRKLRPRQQRGKEELKSERRFSYFSYTRDYFRKYQRHVSVNMFGFLTPRTC